MKGPAIFLAQFASDDAPYNELGAMTKWAASLGYKGVQIPTWDARLFDLEKAASTKSQMKFRYADRRVFSQPSGRPASKRVPALIGPFWSHGLHLIPAGYIGNA